MTQLRSVKQAADALNISPRAVLHRIAAGTINAIKVGDGRTSAYAITPEEIDRVRDADRQQAAS